MSEKAHLLAVPANQPGLVFDCDPGTDDALALKILATGEFKPDWCVSTFGNMPWNYTSRNLNILVKAFGLQSRVAVGAKAPYDGHEVSCGDFHGSDGLADRADSLFDELGMTQEDLDSNGSLEDLAGFICSKNDITYIATGPLSTLSHLITEYPEAAAHIKRVYVMGGGIRRFNKDGDREYNFAGDGEAVKNVFDSSLDITLFPLDITELYALVTPQQMESIDCYGQPCLHAFLARNYKSNSEITKVDAAVLHDCLPVLYLQYPDVFAVEDMLIAADITGHIKLSGQGRLVHVAVSCPENLVYEKLKEAVCGIIQPSSPTVSR